MQTAFRVFKGFVVQALGGPDSRMTGVVRAALGRNRASGAGHSEAQHANPVAAIDPTSAIDSATSTPNVDPERERLDSLARVTLGPDRIPTNFSINLGVAPCNHSCLFCPQSVKKPKKAKWLDLDVLRKSLSEMPEEGILLNISSYSETLAAPNLVPAVRMMKEIRPKLSISMASNGTLFRERVISDLLDAGLDHFQFSFDAPTRETYKVLMQFDHFDRVGEHLERIIEMRDKKGAPTMITTHVMEFEEFEEANRAFKEKWSKKFSGADFADIRRVANWGGTWGLQEQLESNGFTPVYRAPATRFPCTSIFMHFKLTPHGFYAPCVASVPDSLPEEEQHTVPYLGDARDITFTEAWERLRQMRLDHLEGNWDKHECCRNCNVWGLWENFWQDRGDNAPGRPRYHIENVAYIDDDADVSQAAE